MLDSTTLFPGTANQQQRGLGLEKKVSSPQDSLPAMEGGGCRRYLQERSIMTVFA
ncbi:hypothetical protein F2Q69_00049622 [Brassica cretica]|uniref:Uncharacterized protein n=1 Tax=Brassica cretica TaxID=69181 RepID=A0A8S9PZ77_BRACR|nr:hypothetical protein F2Q69_00049622 [Brassica cretica]